MKEACICGFCHHKARFFVNMWETIHKNIKKF